MAEDWETRSLVRRVEGAPFQVGDVVAIAGIVDETFAAAYETESMEAGVAPADDFAIGRHGVVSHLDYSCGCGQVYPGQPMIGVAFEGTELVPEFWPEELVAVGGR